MKNKKTVKYIDLFAGLGGIRLGFTQAFTEAGYETECVLTSEIKPAAIKALTTNFGPKSIRGDITTVDCSEIPDFDFLLAGFPCQAFSVAGRQRGFLDTRGTLFFEVERILREKRPYGFILENVEGLVTHDRENPEDKIGRTFSTILHILEDELRQLKELSVTHGFERFCEKEARREITEFARDLPVGTKIFYGHKDMEPFRPRIDKIVNLLLQTSKPARKADLKFHEDLAMLEQKTKVNGGVLDEIKEDYKRRQGNIVLNAVRTIRAYTPRRTVRGKVNDKNLKRRAGIRARVFGRTLGKLFSSFGEQSELLERDFSHRLQDIEKEIEEQRLQEQVAENTKINTKWNWGK